MRNSFLASPSISMMATLTTNRPDSTRPSLTVTQMRLALGSASLLQSFTQGEKISCGASPAGAACCACGAGCGAAAGACGAGFGAGFFGAGWAAAIAPNITVAVTAAKIVLAVRARADMVRYIIRCPSLPAGFCGVARAGALACLDALKKAGA